MRQTLKTHKHKGIALVAALIFISVFMAASVGMLSKSSQNMLAAENLKVGNAARSTAESGLEIVRYWMQQADTSGAESKEDTLLLVLDALENGLAMADATSIYDNNSQLIGRRIENIVLQSDQSGNALRFVDMEVIYDSAQDAIVLDVTGHTRLNGNASQLSRTLRVGYDFEGDVGIPELSPLFGHGIATKGTFEIDGGTVVGGYGNPSEGSIYIEAKNASQSFRIGGSANISGNVSIANPDHTSVSLTGNPWIDGRAVQPWWPFNPNNFTEQEINDRGVYVNVEEIEFPRPNPHMFRPYATGQEITSNMSGGPYTIDNAIIRAGTNPSFTGVYEIRGVLYIEQPNIVTFGGSCTISAIIVAEGDHENADPDNNKITWSGHVTNNNVQDLPDSPEFAQIRQRQGTSILAPGFELNIGATYNAYERFHGSIVGNGINFTGDPTLVINGTVINYSDDPLVMGGSSKLYFDNENIDTWPDGLEPETGSAAFRIQFNPASYKEVPYSQL